jgi:hypothetical protein
MTMRGRGRPKREFATHEVRATFAAGPYDGARAKLDTLDWLKLFFRPKERTVHAYLHQGDGLYLWSPVLSAGMSRSYDETFARWSEHDTVRMLKR